MNTTLLAAVETVETVDFEFGLGALILVNLIIAVMMLGVGVELELDEFRRTIRRPKGPIVGLIVQFLLLPATAFAFIQLTNPRPAIALGLIIVAACPGGTASNVITNLAGANTSLSIAMTGVSTFLAMVMTPINIAFYASRVEGLSADGVSLNPLGLLATLLLVMGVPVSIGIWLQQHRHERALRLRQPLRIAAVTGLVLLIVGSVAANLGNVSGSVRQILPVVIAMCTIAMALGYASAAAWRLPLRDRRAVSLEVGIQNSALGMTIALQFFDELIEAALVAGLWGMWHIVAGLALARRWSGRSLFRPAAPPVAAPASGEGRHG